MPLSVERILEQKPEVYVTSPDATVLDALQQMALRNVGALLVVDRECLVGIFSERDYARRVMLLGRSSRDTPVRDVMTEDVIVVSPRHTADECMRLMTKHRVRHLPVIDGAALVGVVSIGDVVRAVIMEQQDTISDLVGYIASGA